MRTLATTGHPNCVRVPRRTLNAGATCPSCGSTNTHKVQLMKNGVVVRTYFECNDCGHVW